MGTDINAKAQVWNPDVAGWVNAKGETRQSFHRSSEFFAAFAGAGSATSPEITPVVPRRDPPPDLDYDEIQDFYTYRVYKDALGQRVLDDEGGLYWVTLQELLDFDWDKSAGTLGKSYRRACWEMVEDYIPWLQTLGEPHQVRMIFSFSS